MARLGETDLDVFPLCLGGNVFGWTIDEAGSFEVLDAFRAAGGNFIDTADVYSQWSEAGSGISELIIGRWMAARGNRDEIVIATKVGKAAGFEGLSAETVRRGAEASLERLGIEQIDLYYAHSDDPGTPLEETLTAFGELISDGLIANAAASNYSAARLERALELGRGDGLASFVAVQPEYNLLERGEYEGELMDVASRHGLACIPYFALARGFLTGKYRRDGAEVQSQRASGVRDSYMNDRGFALLDVLDEVAAAHGSSPATISLAWLLARPTVLAPIASATSADQLAELVACAEIELSPGELQALTAAGA
jgi:aryl-alcohol dehydrogenase-like predicted oxidoreductase